MQAETAEPSPREAAAGERGGGRGGILLLAAAALPLLICGGLLVYGSGRGLDLTDEIFYLVWARNPEAYALLYQPFGYLLHPLFALVGFDLQAYRLAGFAIAAAAGALLGGSLAPTGRSQAAFSLYGAGAALTIFFPWIVTPSYNSAANVGAMLVLAGLLNAFAATPGRRGLGALAGGAGVCIAFFAKPPLFAIAALAMLAAALARRRARLPVALALVLGVTLLSFFLAPTEIPALIRRMAATQHILALTNTPAALPAKMVGDWRAVPLALSGAAVAVLLGFALRRHLRVEAFGYAAIALGLFYLGQSVADALDGDISDFIGLALVLLVAGYAVLVQGGERPPLPATAMLLLAPLAVALGTFNNQWGQLNFSMAFPFLAWFALAAADPLAWRRRAALALSVVAPGAAMLLAAWLPYSLPAPIFDQQIPVAPPLARGAIRVDPETADFVEAARGLATGAVLVDLSGTGPGVAAALGARAPVLAWLNPATPRWPDIAWSRMSPAERDRAWFVGPVWPAFAGSAPARRLAAERGRYCPTSLPETPFWGQEKVLQVFRPCRAAGPSAREAR